MNYEQVDTEYRLRHNNLLANIVHRKEDRRQMTAGGSILASRLVQTMQLLVQVHLYNCTVARAHQQKCTTG